jgi:hypothetical protein
MHLAVPHHRELDADGGAEVALRGDLGGCQGGHRAGGVDERGDGAAVEGLAAAVGQRRLVKSFGDG